MCDNCDFGDVHFQLQNEDDDGWSDRVISAKGIEYSEKIHSLPEGTLISIEFKFCPMCGEKY